MEKQNITVTEIDQEFEKIAFEVARSISEEEAAKPNQLLSNKARSERLQKELETEFSSYCNRLDNGLAKIVSSLIELAKEKPELFSVDVGDAITHIASLTNVMKRDEQAFAQQIFAGTTLQALARISDRTLDKFYLGAKWLYDQNLFDDAADAFCFLTCINPNNFAFWLGLGNSEYRRKHYENALWAYAFAYELDPHDPIPHLISFHCYKELGEIENALNALEVLLFVIEGRAEYEDWKIKIEAEKNHIKQRI